MTNPHSTPLHMVQHVADWVAPFPCSQHSPPPPLKFLHIPPSPPPLLPSLMCTRVRSNHHHHYKISYKKSSTIHDSSQLIQPLIIFLNNGPFYLSRSINGFRNKVLWHQMVSVWCQMIQKYKITIQIRFNLTRNPFIFVYTVCRSVHNM